MGGRLPLLIWRVPSAGRLIAGLAACAAGRDEEAAERRARAKFNAKVNAATEAAGESEYEGMTPDEEWAELLETAAEIAAG